MSLTLYYHPLASFCWKPLIALYENETAFHKVLVDLGNAESYAKLQKIWPIGEFPVLQDEERKQIIPQSSVIVEYLSLHHSGKQKLIPSDPELALTTRRWNEFFDNYVHVHMQKIVADVFRPAETKDSVGVAEAHESLRTAYGVLENWINNKTWCAGDSFTLADCSAAPALFYANQVEPFENTHPHLHQYLDRLQKRPSFARVLDEAKPYFHMFPYKRK